MITNTTQGQKSLALLLDEIEEEYKSAAKPEHFYALALLAPVFVKALRRAMQALEEKEALSEAAHVRQNALSELFVIGERLRTQDDRCTSNPMFCVQEKKRDYGYDPRWTDNLVWLDPDDYFEVEPDTKGAIKSGFKDRWQTVMTAFTEEGCEEYLRLNGHNHCGETRIYVESWNRCPEMVVIRTALMATTSVGGGNANQPTLPLSPKVLSEITAILEGKEQEKDSGEPGATNTKAPSQDR